MGKREAPLFEKLVKHYKNSLASFHIPGHKMGKGFNPIGRNYYKEILKLDMTELTGLDDLYQPKGVILEAEKRAAALYQADKTFFLVNGSTSGNLAMILSTCQPGDKIIVQSNVHKSVINGLILARANPIYVNSELLPQLGISAGIKESDLIKALDTFQDVKAVFITNPSYYGINMDIKSISEKVHSYNIPLLVDEAHGAHFGLHPLFPRSAIQQGADIVVQSTHKTLSAMTMGSMLHVKSKYIDIDRLNLFLSMIQTSSPSYPILASLDLTCEWLEYSGERLWHQILKSLNIFYNKAVHLKNIKVVHSFKEKFTLDPLKIIIHSNNEFLSGVAIQKKLEDKKIFTELADLYNTLAVASSGTSNKDINNLFDALMKIDKEINANQTVQYDLKHLKNTCYPDNERLKEVSLDKILYSRTAFVPMHEAAGKIAAEMIIPYPPGIPVVQLGEIISKESIEYLFKLKKVGINIHGIYNNNLKNNIKVIKDTE